MNIYIAVNPQTDEVLDEFRASDLDIGGLYDRFGLPIDVFDKTDGQRFVGSIVSEPSGLGPVIRLRERTPISQEPEKGEIQ